MKDRITLKSLRLWAGCVLFVACASAETTPDGTTNTAWRILAELAAAGARPAAEFNLTRNDPRRSAPLKIAWEGTAADDLSVLVNGRTMARIPGEKAVVVPAEAFQQNHNTLVFAGAGGADLGRVTLWGTVPALTGPRTPERAFFTEHLDTSDPELAAVSQAAARGDLVEARKRFAAHLKPRIPRDAILGEWRQPLSPSQEKEVRNEGLFALAYKVNPVGYEHQFVRHRIDWQFNAMHNGYREWTIHLAYLDMGNQLARYHLLTREAQATETWRDIVGSFIADELMPTAEIYAGNTATWRSLEVATRVRNLSRQIAVFANEAVCDDAFFATLMTSIWEHGSRLRTAPSVRGNWLSNEMSALFYLASYWKCFRESSEWRDYALKRLVEEMSAQVYPDGFQAELAAGYHGGVIAHFRSVLEICGALGEEPPAEIARGVERMYGMYAQLAQPDGVVPGLNDSGIVRCGGALARAAQLFPARADFAWFVSQGERGRPPVFLSHVAPYAGAVTLRSTWDRRAPWVWAYMDASPFGMGHQHEDKLNVLLSAFGQRLIVEGGFYDYDTSAMRAYVLSSRAHNTVRIDGWDQNRRKTFRWRPEMIAERARVAFSETPTADVAEATYDEGYGPDRLAVRHVRKVLLVKDAPKLGTCLFVVDRLTAPDAKEHAFEQLWHLMATDYVAAGDAFTAKFKGGVTLAGAFAGGAGRLVDRRGTKDPELQGWLPVRQKGPHEHQAIPTPVWEGRFTGTTRLVAVFAPNKGRIAPLARIDASSDPAATDITLHFADGTCARLSE